MRKAMNAAALLTALSIVSGSIAGAAMPAFAAEGGG